MKGRKAKFEVTGPRFLTGGGMLTYIVTVCRRTGMFVVREKRRRERAEIPLFAVAKLIMDRHYLSIAREKMRMKKLARKVRRGNRI